MRNTITKFVITGALVLAPVVAAGPVNAAPINITAQAPNQFVIKSDYSVSNLNDILNKLFNSMPALIQPGVTKPEVSVPNTNKPNPTTPVPSKPVPVPTTPAPTVPVKPTTPAPTPTAPAKPTTPAPTTPVKPTTPTPTNPTTPNQENSDFAAQVVNLVNQERAKAGLPALKSDAALTNVAMIKAKDMYNNNYFDHNSPTLGSPFDLMSSQGIQYRAAGENIAKGQRTPTEVMNAWMNSDGHRKNILSANYTSIGVAYYNGEWVQEFTG